MFVSNFSVAASYSTRAQMPGPVVAEAVSCGDQASLGCEPAETSNWSCASALTANFDPWVLPSKSEHSDSGAAASGASSASASVSGGAKVSASGGGSAKAKESTSEKTCTGGSIDFNKEGGLLGGKVKSGECCPSDTNKKSNECKADSKTGKSEGGKSEGGKGK